MFSFMVNLADCTKIMFERSERRRNPSAGGSIFPQKKVSIFEEKPVMHKLIHIIHRFSPEKYVRIRFRVENRFFVHIS